MPTLTTRQPTAPTRTNAATLNEEHARHRIDGALHRRSENDPVDRDTARLIAATIHDGSTSALGRFAASGQLDRPSAAVELLRLQPGPPVAWCRALEEYLLQEAHHGTA